jgi:putative ABC transport system substrate-binding protein
MMRRRQFIAGLAGATTLTMRRAAHAQQDLRMRWVGVLYAGPQADQRTQTVRPAFVREMQVLGWSEGRNFGIESRFPDGGFDQMKQFAKELVALRPDAIFAPTGVPGVRALMQETRTIPIVFTGVSDPVALGFVAWHGRAAMRRDSQLTSPRSVSNGWKRSSG